MFDQAFGLGILVKGFAILLKQGWMGREESQSYIFSFDILVKVQDERRRR